MKYNILDLAKTFFDVAVKVRHKKDYTFEIEDDDQDTVSILDKNGVGKYFLFYFNYPNMNEKPCFELRKGYDGTPLLEVPEENIEEFLKDNKLWIKNYSVREVRESILTILKSSKFEVKTGDEQVFGSVADIYAEREDGPWLLIDDGNAEATNTVYHVYATKGDINSKILECRVDKVEEFESAMKLLRFLGKGY